MYAGVHRGQETGAGANLDSGGAAPLPSLPIWSRVFATCSHSRVLRPCQSSPVNPAHLTNGLRRATSPISIPQVEADEKGNLPASEERRTDRGTMQAGKRDQAEQLSILRFGCCCRQ